jgi:hypothetical protein
MSAEIAMYGDFEVTAYGIVVDGKVYDNNMKLILDTDDYEDVLYQDEFNMIIKETVKGATDADPDTHKYFIFDEKGRVDIASPDGLLIEDVYASEGMYMLQLKDVEGKYYSYVYNLSGELLIKSTPNLVLGEPIIIYETGAVFSMADLSGAEPVYSYFILKQINEPTSTMGK